MGTELGCMTCVGEKERQVEQGSLQKRGGGEGKWFDVNEKVFYLLYQRCAEETRCVFSILSPHAQDGLVQLAIIVKIDISFNPPVYDITLLKPQVDEHRLQGSNAD